MRNHKPILFILLINSMTMSISSAGKELLPETIGPWSIRTDTVYTQENLYDYINGGAELYISFGFKEVISRIYSAENQPDIIVDIFNMNSAPDAYGVFRFSAEDIDQFVGQGTQHNEGFMLFWMDHYFVSLISYPETPESKGALMKLARGIEKGIGISGKLPGILGFLPKEGLQESSIRYFHHYAWLNSHYYIADENILLIDDDTEVVIAKYGDPSHRCVLLVADYPTKDHAEKASQEFTGSYLPEARAGEPLRLEDETYAGIELTGSTIIIVLNAISATDVKDLTARAKNRILNHK